MIATLRESKAKLSELVERAAGGEEILITVRGRPRARLVAAQTETPGKKLKGWAGELRLLQRTQEVPRKAGSVVEELREERW